MTDERDPSDYDLIDEGWLKACGFVWSQEERQPSKHWTLWLGMAGRFAAPEDLGVEVASVGHDTEWFCWMRSDSSHRYARFIHIRHLTARYELIDIVSALSGQQWNPRLNRYGRVCTPEQIHFYDAEDARLQARLRRTGALEGIGVDAKPADPQPLTSTGEAEVTDRLREAIRAVTRELVGVQRIKVEADPLYGVVAHERWYPKATLVDTDALVGLQEAWKARNDR